MKTIAHQLQTKPYITDFFDIHGLILQDTNITIAEFAANLPYKTLENLGIDKKRLVDDFFTFITRMEEIKSGIDFSLNNITIIGGTDKDGKAEEISIEIHKGETICINGVTGSGKTRLLEDIEWLAQGDSPTQRKILINNKPVPKSLRRSGVNQLVAQLSQNMNFVMDINVEEFINLHAKCRLNQIDPSITNKILTCANDLSGESFDLQTPLTSLSGGQARALMIADIAFLSLSPIVLIDEIENAGINKMQALKLLTDKKKIILIATHDPILALSADKRILICNGGISKLSTVSKQDEEQLETLIEMDRFLNHFRYKLRKGKI